MSPMEFFRNRLDSWMAHPVQNIASTVAGGLLGPEAGFGAQHGFQLYNDNRFNNAAQNLGNRSLDLSTLNTNDRMNAPLADPRLSGDNQFGWSGPTGPNDGQSTSEQDRQLMGALTGGGGSGGGYGGPAGGMPQSYGGPSMSGQQWIDRSGGFGNVVGQLLGVAPDQSSLVNQLLDPISMGAGLPGSGYMNHQERQDYRDNLGNNGAGISPNYGVSNFNVGGSPVIFGMNGFDPNGRHMYNQTDFGG